MRLTELLTLFLAAICVAGAYGVAAAKDDDVGTVIAVRGKAIIERGDRTLEARAKDGILLRDAVSTMEASRAKMLFIDDSVLSMGERSRVVIREFLYSRDKGGRSIFNLIEGKMKSVVGKTGLEIHTPTAVGAARGTIILTESGVVKGKKFVTFICTEGELVITSQDPRITDKVSLTEGMMITIVEGEPFRVPFRAPQSEIDRLESATDFEGIEIPISGPTVFWPGWLLLDVPYTPPIQQQPARATTPVTIDLIFK